MRVQLRTNATQQATLAHCASPGAATTTVRLAQVHMLEMTSTPTTCRVVIIQLAILTKHLYAGPRFYQSKLNDQLAAGAKFGTNNILVITLTADSSDDFVAGVDAGTANGDQADAITRAFEAVPAS